MPAPFGGPGRNSLFTKPTPSPLGAQIGGPFSNLQGDVATAGGNMGAGQGPVPGTGQLGQNPFNNTFNWQIPSYQSSSDGTGTVPAPSTSSGISQYVPVIIVGVIIAGLGYYLFERKRK